MLHPRVAQPRLRRLAQQFPAVLVLGPRQIGKSTLAKMVFADYDAFDLENPLDLARLRADPLLVLAEHRKIIIDEAQRLPEIFPILRSHLDRRPSARAVVLGSAAPRLLREVSESLTGRVGLFELGGLLVDEARAPALWLSGAFPRVHWSRPRARPEEWYPAYLRTCLEQDVPQLGFSVPAQRLRTLLTMVAGAQGGLCNLSTFGSSLGVSYHTVAAAFDVLESIFLIRRLPPYFANIGKRLVKSPKVYIRDTGLLHHLLGIPFARKNLIAHAAAGASFETFCIEQIILHAQLVDPGAEFFFYRTHTGQEVDLLLKLHGRLIPVEIKLGLGVPDVRGLETCMADLGLRRGFVVYAGSERVQLKREISMIGLEAFIADVLGPRNPRRRPPR